MRRRKKKKRMRRRKKRGLENDTPKTNTTKNEKTIEKET